MTTDMTPLADMIDSLDTGWTEETDWAELYVRHDGPCHDRQLAATVGQLRHWSCECEVSVEAKQEMRARLPLLLELTEASFAKPVIASEGGGGTKLHPPLPGDLENVDEVMRSIQAAAETICRDWSISESGLLVENLAAIRMEIGARLASERDDEAAVLRPAWQAARRHLGYDRRPIRLRCDCGARMGLEGLEIVCEGSDCSRRVAITAELAAVMVVEATRRRCRRRHDPAWTINAQGNQVCQTCTDLLASRRKARKAKDDARKIGQLGEGVGS